MLNRLKAIRKYTGLSQTEFARRINMSQSGYGQIETGNRVLNDRIIKLICLEFSINDAWIRNGEGKMVVEDDEALFAAFTEKYKLTDVEQDIARYCLELSSEQRTEVLNYILDFADMIRLAQLENAPAGLVNGMGVSSAGLVAEKGSSYRVEKAKKTKKKKQ